MRLADRARVRVAGAGRWFAARPRLANAAFVLLSAFLVVWTYYYAGQADRWTDQVVYSRVQFWIASSECAARTGVLLGHCRPDGGVEAIESASIADDRGHTLVANLYALLAGEAITLRGLVVANIIINAGALFALALALFLHGWKLSALFLLLAPRYVVPGPLPSPDGSAAYIAAFLFALVAAVLVAHMPLRRRESAAIHWLVIAALAALCLGWSTLLRQPYGYAGFLVVLLVLGARWLWERRHSTSPRGKGMALRAGTVIAVLAFATFYGTSALFVLRGLAYDLPRSETAIEAHGISHNLYLGLGVPGNPWGITWDDHAALTHIGAADRVTYGSNDHYRSLREGYLRIVMNEPLRVASVYRDKLIQSVKKVTQSPNPERKAAIALLVFVVLLLYLNRAGGLSQPESAVLVAAWASFCMILVQGVLALPEHLFINPGKYAAICGFAVLWECGVRRVLQLPPPASA